LDDSVAHIELIEWKSSPGKTIAIPSRIKNGLIHRPIDEDIIEGYNHLFMNDTDAYFLHLGGVFDKNMVSFLNNQILYI
jgi:hypothetical protein